MLQDTVNTIEEYTTASIQDLINFLMKMEMIALLLPLINETNE